MPQRLVLFDPEPALGTQSLPSTVLVMSAI